MLGSGRGCKVIQCFGFNLCIIDQILAYQYAILVILNALRETGEMFIDICPNNLRDKPTLEKMILNRVRRGTTIITDGWASYVGLTELGNVFDCCNVSGFKTLCILL